MIYPQMNRYEIERLRNLERAAEREQKALNASQEVDEMDDAAIVAKHMHLNNIEACDELLKRLRTFHPERNLKGEHDDDDSTGSGTDDC